MRSRKKTQLSRFARALCAAHIHMSVSDFTDIFFKNHHNSIKLCWNKSKKMPRLNNDERNQAIGIAKCRRVNNCCIVALWLHSKDYRAFTETMSQDRPRSGRPRVTTAADDRYIVTGVWLQQQPEDSSIFFPSHWLLSHITIVETADSGERGMNPVAMTIINSRKEYWPRRGSNQWPPVLKYATLPTELWGGYSNKRPPMSLPIPTRQNFGPDQIESICRRQDKCNKNDKFCLW